jgi:hypothetical protein
MKTMRVRVVPLLVGVAFLSALAGARAQQVWKTIIAPNQPLSMHRHDFGRVIVALKGGTLKIVPEKGEPKAVVWETGKAYWLGADPPNELHGDLNEGPETMEVMVIEMRR